VSDDEPSVLTRYLLDLAAAFNAFYSGGHRILSDDAVLSAARITLVAAVHNTLDRGLAILGIPRPQRM
jgi:arginyl-tRNA synthetase